MAGRNMSVFDSDEEDDMFDNMLTVTARKPKVFKNRPNYFIEYTDLQFFTRFRMQKQTCETLLHLIVNDLKSQTERNRAISPATKLLLTKILYHWKYAHISWKFCRSKQNICLFNCETSFRGYCSVASEEYKISRKYCHQTKSERKFL
ncbi:uncharacterized protein LOC125503964 [Dendroctonus ponderosae]|uniref:uncharacterized protein LOC125503964 n=1 Tax=Dendroctonus ponderosae TaxID=77166 RepID=UPI002034DC40|nr:uncharacterized protein LOC125503964 [Dendroctonus ponderosae]